MMRRVYDKRDEAARKARQARHDILTRHTRQATAAAVTKRLNEIRHARTSGTMTQNTRIPVAQADVDQHPAPHAAILDSLERLTVQLSPTPQVAPGRPLRRLLIGAQSVLFRVLRPYWFQQQQLQRSLIAAFATRCKCPPGPIRRSRHSVKRWKQPGRRYTRYRRNVTRRARQAPTQSAGQRSVPQVRHLIDEVGRINEMTKTVIPHVNQLTEDVTAHTQALNAEVGRVAVSSAALEHRLYAPPYLTDPDRLHVTDREGRRVLGYERPVGESGYATFEDMFRGAEDFIRDRQRVLRTDAPTARQSRGHRMRSRRDARPAARASH